MSTVSLNSIKSGETIKLDGQPCVVISTQHVHMGRGGAILRIKIKNLITNAVIEKTLKGEEKAEIADLAKSKASFLYQDPKNVFFMDTQTYEQFSIPKDLLGDKIFYLKEGSEAEILSFEEKPINVNIATKVDLKVIGAPPGVRGDSAQGNPTKPATLETGLIINVPLFVKEGDVIRINTDTGKYVERVN